MALKKSIELSSGFSAEYWRISILNRGIAGDSIVVEGFKDKASRDAKKTPIGRKVFKHSPLLTIADAYVYLKTKHEFTGAEDL